MGIEKSSSVNSLEDQEKLFKKFKAKSFNKEYLPGKKVYLTLPTKQALYKESTPKRAAVFTISEVNFDSLPAMYKLKEKDSNFLYHRNELLPAIEGEKVLTKFPTAQIIGQRESKSGQKQVKLKDEHGNDKWVDIFELLNQK